MIIAINAYGMPSAGLAHVPAAKGRSDANLVGVTCAVQLIDRRTGRPHRVGGAPFTVFTKTPHLASAEIMQGRDPGVWETRIEPLKTAEVRK